MNNECNVIADKWQFALGYLDDINIFFRDAVENISHVRTAQSVLHKAGIKWNLEKCNFFIGKIDYVGHVIPPWKLELNDHTNGSLRSLKPPCNITS